MAMLEQKFLQVGPIAHIEPGVRGDEAERTLVIQQRQAKQIEIDVQVTLLINWIRHSLLTILVCIAKEAWEEFVDHMRKLCFIGFVIFLRRIFQVGSVNVLLSQIGRIANHNAEATLLRKDFTKSDIPYKRECLRCS